MKQKDPYKLLGVEKNANDAVIKKAYYRAAKEFHPDRNKGRGAEDKFKEIGQAYETLKNPLTKWDYDNLSTRNANKPQSAPPRNASSARSKQQAQQSTDPGFTFTDGSFKFKQRRPLRRGWTEDGNSFNDNIFRTMFAGNPFDADCVRGDLRHLSQINRNRAGLANPQPTRTREDVHNWLDPLNTQQDKDEDDMDFFTRREQDVCGKPDPFGIQPLPCSYCYRPFNVLQLNQHEKVCRRLLRGHKTTPARPNFSPRQQPLSASFDASDDSAFSPQQQRTGDGRVQHDELIRNIRNRRDQQLASSQTNGNQGHVPPPQMPPGNDAPFPSPKGGVNRWRRL